MKLIDIQKVTDFKHLNLFSTAYRDKADQLKSWIFASRSEKPFERDVTLPDAVVVVPFHKDERKLVIIREFRVALAGYQYGFPAGLVDAGESIEQAGKRELFEETGLKIEQILQKSPPIYSSSGMTDESVSMLYVECSGTPDTSNNEESEDIEVLMFSPDEAGRLLESPGIKFDVKSWIVLNSFVRQGMI